MSALPGSGFSGKLPSLGSGAEKWRIEKPERMALGSGPGKEDFGSDIEYMVQRRSENLRRRSSYTPYETGEYAGGYQGYRRGEGREKWGLPY